MAYIVFFQFCCWLYITIITKHAFKIFFFTLMDSDLWGFPLLTVDANQRNQVFSCAKINPTSPQLGFLGRAGFGNEPSLSLSLSHGIHVTVQHISNYLEAIFTRLCCSNMQPATVCNPPSRAPDKACSPQEVLFFELEDTLEMLFFEPEDTSGF